MKAVLLQHTQKHFVQLCFQFRDLISDSLHMAMMVRPTNFGHRVYLNLADTLVKSFDVLYINRKLMLVQLQII